MKRFLSVLIVLCLLASAAPDCDARKKKTTRRKTPARTEQLRDSKSVRNEKKKNAREIEATKKQIKTNESETRRQLSKLSMLDAEIREQDKSLEMLRLRHDSITKSVRLLTDSVARVEARSAALREAYGENLRTIRSQRQGMSTAAFIFSAGTFSKMFRRMRYMNELKAWQQDRQQEMRALSEELSKKKIRLEKEEARLSASVTKLDRARRGLAVSQSKASVLVDSLKRQGSNLRSILREKQERSRRLDAELDRIIAEEARKAAEEEVRRRKLAEERRKAAEAAAAKAAREAAAAEGKPTSEGKKPMPAKEKPKTEFDKQPEKQTWALSEYFVSNKGKLPAPVDSKYTIVSTFGRNAHPDMSKIQVQNNGIDIATPAGASAKAVFGGTVSSIFRLDGFDNIVIIRHGEYLTVYAGLATLNVHKGENVYTGKLLGKIAPDPDNPSQSLLHFEVRRERVKLNPLNWLK